MIDFIDIMADCFFTEYEENISYDKAEKAIADHDKQIRDEVISEILKNVEFEEKWLSDAWKENGYNYSSRDIDIAFSGIKHSLRKMKGEQNE